MKKRYLFPIVFVSCGLACNAQISYSNGAIISVTPGAVVWMNGGLTVSNSSTFTNNGTITITKNSTLPLAGTLNLENNSSVNGNGTYRVEQDWINSANFSAGNSSVELFGNTQQFITSNNNTITTFNRLDLSGSGTGINRKKTLQGVDANVGANGVLAINDRELETQTQSFFVLNPSTLAVTNNTTPGNEGFVSSINPGTFSRQTNTASAYLFPTGSSTGTLRYRPVELTPVDANPNTYVARLNNTDATTQGFDRNITDGSECDLNPLYYHAINRTSGSSSSDVKLFYVQSNDGDWSGIAQWKLSAAAWNDISAAGSGTSGIFKTRTRSSWAFANPGDPYILTNVRPNVPQVNCPALCENSDNNVFTLTGNASSYQWTFPSNGTIVSGQGTSNVTANWSTGTGLVSVIAIGTAGCNSLPGTCTPTILPPPPVQFTYSGDLGEYGFTDLTSGATLWNWNFGDGTTSTSQNPSHIYTNSGSYTVVLNIENAAGCTNSTSIVIDVIDEIVVPNVITPNGDGVNDVFLIKSGGLKTYDLTILNRWGTKVFTSDNANTHWDGKHNGKAVAEGVYYYILKASTNNKEYEFHGNVTVFN